MDETRKYDDAVQIIKTAILRSQYDAARSVNEKQLMLYYGIGRYSVESFWQLQLPIPTRDYSSPMGVATYKTAKDMPEELRKALPDVDDLRRLLDGDAKRDTP